MGKGDKKTRRGKIVIKSYGVRRPQRTKKIVVAALPPVVAGKTEPKPEKKKIIEPVLEEIIQPEVKPETKKEKPKAPRAKKKPATPKKEQPPATQETKTE